MFRRVLLSVVVLGLGSAVHAAALVSLVPATPANGVFYVPGEFVRVDFFVQLDAAMPSSIRLRLLQFDLSDSSPELSFIPIMNHPLAAIGPIPFWNLSGAAACAGDEALCGTNYFIDGRIPATEILPENLLDLVYAGFTPSDDFQVILRQATATLIGSLDVLMPATVGDYLLDVLNADNTDANLGAELRYGFGTPGDPEWGILRAETGEIVMVSGPGTGTDEQGRIAFAVIPEPATILLLGLGGLALTLRHRITWNR